MVSMRAKPNCPSTDSESVKKKKAPIEEIESSSSEEVVQKVMQRLKKNNKKKDALTAANKALELAKASQPQSIQGVENLILQIKG